MVYINCCWIHLLPFVIFAILSEGGRSPCIAAISFLLEYYNKNYVLMV